MDERDEIFLAISKQLHEIGSDVAVVKAFVLGNGTPGLVTTVNRHSHELDQMWGVIHLARWLVPIVVTIGGTIGGIVVAVLRQ